MYVIEGRSRWSVSDQEREAVAGDVLIVRAGGPHKFSNTTMDRCGNWIFI
jgi:quercetin dioxygenase-like cupin family protein